MSYQLIINKLLLYLNKNLFWHKSKMHSPPVAHIFHVIRDRGCDIKNNLICITCHEFRNFVKRCPKIYLHKVIETNLIHQNCNLKIQAISLPIQNYTCTQFGNKGFAFTF